MSASHAAGVLGALTERDRSQQDKSLRHPLLATDRALPRVTTSGPSRRPVVPADDGPQNVIALFGGVLSLRSHVWSALVEDLKAFRRVCHEAASRTGGTVTEFRISTDVTPNFHQGIIAYPDRAIAVVCVRDTTILALAEPRVIEFAPTRESGPLTFVDAPGLAAALAENRNSDCSPPPS